MAGWKLRVTGGTGGMVADAAELRRGISLFAQTDGFFEIRSLTTGAHRHVWGDNLDGILKAVEELPSGIGMYFILNPIREGLIKAATNGDVLARRWLFIDIDPIRSEEFKDYPASDKEKALAASVADSVIEYLHERGWPAPVVTDSGNGVGLFYRCDLPNDDVVKQTLSRLLRNLDARFSNAHAKIDKAVHNAARLAKLPGTWARKGTATPDRPHRPCRILSEPRGLGLVSFDDLKDAAEVESTPTPQPSLNGTHRHSDASAYGKKALDSECARIALGAVNRGGEGRNNALNKAAYSLGQLVAGGVLSEGEVKDRLWDAARDCGLDKDPGCGERGIGLTIQSGLEAGKKLPRAPEEKKDPKPVFGQGETTTQSNAKEDLTWSLMIDGEVVDEGLPVEILPVQLASSKKSQSFEMYTLSGLMAANFPEPTWVIPGLLSEGLNILAGKPKMGKSMMALNMAITIAAGGKALGNMQTTPGDVLYISLEDRTRRIQARARKMLKGLGCEASSRLIVASSWPRQGNGGLEMIEWWIKRVKKPTLCIIDVWGKFRPAGNPKANQYSQDYEHMSPLKDLLDRVSCCGLSLMHCRKGSSEDVVEDVSGTLGLAGSADGIIVLQRSRNDNEAKIFVTGRDVSDTELALRFDPESLVWNNLGSAEAHITGKLQLKIINYLKGLGGTPAFSPEIAEAIDEEPDNIRKVLHRLHEKRLVRKHGKAWAYPGEEEMADEGL